jgi:hypothetical protein
MVILPCLWVVMECGGQRTVYGEGMGVNIWAYGGRILLGYPIFQNQKIPRIFFRVQKLHFFRVIFIYTYIG